MAHFLALVRIYPVDHLSLRRIKSHSEQQSYKMLNHSSIGSFSFIVGANKGECNY